MDQHLKLAALKWQLLHSSDRVTFICQLIPLTLYPTSCITTFESMLTRKFHFSHLLFSFIKIFFHKGLLCFGEFSFFIVC